MTTNVSGTLQWHSYNTVSRSPPLIFFLPRLSQVWGLCFSFSVAATAHEIFLSHFFPEPGSRAGYRSPISALILRKDKHMCSFHFTTTYFRETGDKWNNKDEKGFSQSFKEQKPIQIGWSKRSQKHLCYVQEPQSSCTSFSLKMRPEKLSENKTSALPASPRPTGLLFPMLFCFHLLHLIQGPYGLQCGSHSFQGFRSPGSKISQERYRLTYLFSPRP